MATRDIEATRTVSPQVNQVQPSMLNMVADMGLNIIETSQKAKIVENTSSANLELNALNNELRIKYEGNPEEGIKQMREKRKEIFDRYGKDISPMFKGLWNENVLKLQQKDDLENQSWSIKQSRINTINSINKSIKDNTSAAYEYGRSFGKGQIGLDKAINELDITAANLLSFSVGSLGSETASNLMTDYSEDYMKMFLTGVIEENPLQAKNILESELVKKSIRDPKILKAMKDAADSNILKLTQKADTEMLIGEIGRNADILDRRVNGNLSYMDIEIAQRDGSISDNFADYLKKGLSKPDINLTSEEKLGFYNELWTEYSSFGIRKEDGKVKFDKSNMTLSNVIKFQDKVNQYLSEGKIDMSAAKSLSNASRMMLNSMKEPLGEVGIIWDSYSKMAKEDTYRPAYDSIISFLNANKTLDTPDNRYNYINTMVKVVDEIGDINNLSNRDKKKALQQIGQKVMSEVLYNQYPQLQNIPSDKLPSSFRDNDGKIIFIPKNLQGHIQGMNIQRPQVKKSEYRKKDGSGFIKAEEIETISKEQNISFEDLVVKLKANGIIE